MDVCLHLHERCKLIATVGAANEKSGWVDFDIEALFGEQEHQFTIFFHGDENKIRMEAIAKAINEAFAEPKHPGIANDPTEEDIQTAITEVDAEGPMSCTIVEGSDIPELPF